MNDYSINIKYAAEMENKTIPRDSSTDALSDKEQSNLATDGIADTQMLTSSEY